MVKCVSCGESLTIRMRNSANMGETEFCTTCKDKIEERLGEIETRMAEIEERLKIINKSKESQM